MAEKKSAKSKKGLIIGGAVGLVLVVAILVGLWWFVIPRYDVAVEGAETTATEQVDGVKVVRAKKSVACNAKETETGINCEEVTLLGMKSTNQNVLINVPDGVELEEKEDKLELTVAPVSFKKVVVRAEIVTEPETREYEITMKKDGETVLRYVLSLETTFSEADLALINKIPSGEEVAAALQTIETVDGVCIVTEDNDPNGNLNKTGGYVAAVYFSDNRAYQEMKTNPYADYKDICAMGTVAGGQIEVYGNVEDAKKRADYLGAFAGGILSSGDSYVYGTSVFRISNEMTATQMGELKEAVVKALTE